ncbi:hypothetical protein BDZ91DRAFT_764653 [Kalaharituber pfeilii]|nr:hypothetical protein BDZ91DRAFT_764653 [Kalaharituber pfeilii]
MAVSQIPRVRGTGHEVGQPRMAPDQDGNCMLVAARDAPGRLDWTAHDVMQADYYEMECPVTTGFTWWRCSEYRGGRLKTTGKMTGDSKFTLREATKEQIKQARKGHAASWAAGLTVEQYLGREEHIASQPLTRNGGIKFWVLTDATDPTKVLCSCETMAKEAVVRLRNGGVERTLSHVIGSVFTPEKNRGRGYASVMLDKMTELLDGVCLFDALYSDIGKRFYAKKGWKPYRSTHISLPPAADDIPSPEGLKMLMDNDLPELCQQDCDSVIKDFATRPLPENVDVRVAYLPTYAVMQWHHAREEYVGKHLTGKLATVKGALAPSGKTWCIWTRTFNTKDRTQQKLSILRLVDEDDNRAEEKRKDEIIKLLRAAQCQAQLWDMKEVAIWNPSERVVKAAEKIMGREVKVVEREMESIASLRWNGDGKGETRVWWDLNEKYSWC